MLISPTSALLYNARALPPNTSCSCMFVLFLEGSAVCVSRKKQKNKKNKSPLSRRRKKRRSRDEKLHESRPRPSTFFLFFFGVKYFLLCSCHYMPFSHGRSLIKRRGGPCGEERRKTVTYFRADVTVCHHPSLPPSVLSAGNPIITCG